MEIWKLIDGIFFGYIKGFEGFILKLIFFFEIMKNVKKFINYFNDFYLNSTKLSKFS